MHLKRFTAPTMQEALKLIKTELGRDAIILDTRKIEGRDGKPSLEITAAIEAPLPEKNQQTNSLNGSHNGLNNFNNSISTTSQTPEISLADISQAPAPRKLEDYLIRHGVLPEIKEKIIGACAALADTGFDDFDVLDMVLGKMIPFTTPAKALKKGKVHIFIGPTGSGKTTTLCKLAIERKVDKHSVAMVTMDNQKVGAFEQLNIFAEAMKEDARMIRNANDLSAAMLSFGVKDYLFIDTPGLSPFSKQKMQLLQERIKVLNVDACVHLVLPATLNPLEMIAIPPACAMLHPDTVIFTKMDETSHFGGITNVAVMSGLKVCFLTDGPKVPDDIMEMDSTVLAEKLNNIPKLPWEIS